MKGGEVMGLRGGRGGGRREDVDFEVRGKGEDFNGGLLFNMCRGVGLKGRVVCRKRGKDVKKPISKIDIPI